ncbi:MAG: hypothetical protein ACOC2U_00370 [bacterium]
MMQKAELKNKLQETQKEKLLAHFNEIYECHELGEHEYNIIYLAWLWADGFVIKDEYGSMLDNSVKDVGYNDYEITFEDGEGGGGMNLDYFYVFYQLDKIMELMNWNE